MNKYIYLQELGLIAYEEAWAYQTRLFEDILGLKAANRNAPEPAPTPNYLLFCQHPHVYTLGRNGKPEHLRLPLDGLAEIGATYCQTNRGGDITYHGPGQLVVYPVLDMENFFTDIHKYMRLLEEAVIRTLADFGVAAGRIPGLTGVWLDHDGGPAPRKICALGVKTSRWAAMHGLALNVNTDLAYFNHIIPCGIADKAVTSLAVERNGPQDIQAVSLALRHHIVQLFGMQPVPAHIPTLPS